MIRHICISVFCLICIVITAEPGMAQDISFGVKGGLNLSTIVGDHYDIPEGGVETITGFCGGGFIVYRLNDMFSIQAEGVYSMKGMKWETATTINGIPATCKYQWNLDYIEIPLLMKYSFQTKKSIIPVIFVGPCFSFNLSAKDKVDCEGRSDGSYVWQTGEGELEDINSTDLGIVFGAGLELDISKSSLLLDIRYTLGLTKIRDYEDTSEKNAVISLMIGYMF